MPAHVLVRLVQHTREGVVILTLAVAILRAHVDMQRQRWRGLTKSRHAGINRRDAFSRARIHMLAACTHRATIGSAFHDGSSARCSVRRNTSKSFIWSLPRYRAKDAARPAEDRKSTRLNSSH